MEGGWLQHRPASTAPDSMVPKALALQNAGHDEEVIVGQVLAIDVGGTFIKYALVDEGGVLTGKGKVPTPLEGLDDFIDAVQSIYQVFHGEVAGIALNIPGVVDRDAGFMRSGGALEYNYGVPLAKLIEARILGVNVSIENDGKAAVWAEMISGALADCDSGAVVICRTAVGGGAFVGREVLRGRNFFAGEYSYISVGKAHETDKTRWLGWATGVPGLIKEYQHRSGETDIDGEELFARADRGDEDALASLRRYCSELAVQILNIQCVLDPERFAVGGGISAQPLFLKILNEEIRDAKKFDDDVFPLPQVVACRYFNDANLLGAVYNFRGQFGSA